MRISEQEYQRRVDTAFDRNPNAPVGSIASEIVDRPLEEEEERANGRSADATLNPIEQKIVDVLAAHRGQDGEPEWMRTDDLDRAIGCEGVHAVFVIVDGLRRHGRILYEFRRGRYGDAAYYRAV